MKTMLKSAMAASLALTFVGAFVGTAEAKKCSLLGGKGTGALPEIAKDQALWQLSDAAKAYGGKAAGKAKVSCGYQLVVSECTVTQRYCK